MQSIIEWLNQNKQWFFSGIGVLFLTTVWMIWKGLLGRLWCAIHSWKLFGTATENRLANAKANTHILFIDDDIKFKVVDILKTAGWHYTTIVKDITSLDETIVQQSQIFFIDINGVGKKLGFKDEGLGLALALKTSYPNKKVVIYSADTKAERFHEAWKRADEYLAKNADPYEFQQVVRQLAIGADV